MPKKILVLCLIFLLTIISVNAQLLSRQPLIANTFFFNASTTASTTYETIGEDIFEVTRSTPISFVRASFQGTKTTGTFALDDFIWRVLLDGIEVINSTQSLELEETAPIELQAGLGDLSIGFHNVTFQHKVVAETLRTSEISFSILTNQFLNGSSVPLGNESISFTVDDIEIFTKFVEFNFTKLRNDSGIFLSIFGQVTTIDSNVDQEIKVKINLEESGVVSTGLQDPTEKKFVTYSWFFKDAEIGINTIEIFSRNLQNTKVTSFDGDVSFAETIVDNIEINANDTHVGTFITSSTIPVLIDSIMLNISNGSTAVIISESTVSKSTSGKDNITMFVDISGFGTVFNHTIQLEGSADIGNFPFIEVPPSVSTIWGLKNISLFAFVESTTATFTNTSFFAIEILPIEILVIVDDPPFCSLISPVNNLITNETSIQFEINVTDDVLVSNVSLFHNHSGIFVLNETATVNANISTVTFNKTIPHNETIIWNGFVTDNVSQSVFCGLNFTLTINQTFPPDTLPPVITLISPQNNTVNNTIPLNITFQISDNSPFDIICNLNNNTFTFDDGTFTQGVNQNLTLLKGVSAISQNFPNLNLICFDNSPANNSATLNLNYTLDTIPPIITIISPLNGDEFNKQAQSSILVVGNCTDVPVFRFNITITNASNTVFSEEDLIPVNNVMVINSTLDISILGTGGYNLLATCSDPHTIRELSGNYNVRKNKTDNSIRYITPSGNSFKIRMLTDIQLKTYGSEREGLDRYKFWYNINESARERTIIFEVIGNQVTYLKNSKYPGHFILNNENWLDFELSDPMARYMVTKNGNGNYEVEIITSLSNLNFNSVGELNIATQQISFSIIDQEIPVPLFQVGICPISGNNLPLTIFYIFLILLSIGIMLIGNTLKIGIVGFIGSMMLLVLSIFMFACLVAIAFLLVAMSIMMSSYFLFRGFRNFE